jgi:hypothetical protein
MPTNSFVPSCGVCIGDKRCAFCPFTVICAAVSEIALVLGASARDRITPIETDCQRR